MDYIDYILPVYFDKAEEPDIQGNGFFIDKLFITAAHILEKYRAQNETYMCRSAENVVKSLCFNKLCAVG